MSNGLKSLLWFLGALFSTWLSLKLGGPSYFILPSVICWVLFLAYAVEGLGPQASPKLSKNS